MSVVLFGIGAFAVLVGVVMAGFGVPVSASSLGNTLIVSGTTAAVGGLILIGLGAAIAQLQRLNEALGVRLPNRSGRPLDSFEPAAGSRKAPASGRIPFPAKPKSEAGMREPQPLEPRMAAAHSAGMPMDEGAGHSFAPMLHNPDEPPVTVDDEVSLSPQHPMPAGAAAFAPSPQPFGFNGSGMVQGRHEPALDAGWQQLPPPPQAAPAAQGQPRQQQAAYFDAMWPAADAKSGNNPAGGQARAEPSHDAIARQAAAAPAKRPAPEMPNPRPANETRVAAILKSGVVDGMGYTLYVDGSIEAELPQGTLRFASINELRSHLEKNG